MSFSTIVKEEIAKQDWSKSETLALLSSFLRNNAIITQEKIEVITENPEVAQYIYKTMKELYRITIPIDQKKNNNFTKNRLYVLTIIEKQKMILEDLGVINQSGYYLLEPPEYLVTTTEDQRAYLAGIFLACGSINDPKTSRYHLEFTIDMEEEAQFVHFLLNNFDLNSKVLSREKGYMVYIKEAEKIGDYLRMIRATNALLYFEDIRILRDHRNMTNRLNNMEQANTDKIVETATKQLEDIEYIKDKMGLDFLDDKTREVATYRLKYQEASLQELSEIISLETNHPITKSGLNHRFRKMRELVNKWKGAENHDQEGTRKM